MKFKVGDILTVTGNNIELHHGFDTGDMVKVVVIEGIYNHCQYADKPYDSYIQWVTDDCLCEPFELKVKKAAELYDENEHGRIDSDTK